MDRAGQLAVLSGASADQWGLVTAAQAKKLGLSAVQLLRLVEADLLVSVSHGVYLLTVSGMPSHVEIKAAWLRLQPKEFAWDRTVGHRDSGVVSHASACQLHDLGDIPAPEVELTVPRRRTTTEPFVRLRTGVLDASDITVADGLPVTTAARTITDLLRARADGGHIGAVIADAARRDLLDLDDLAERVQPQAGRYGLKATATGEDLIDHLVGQAGATLHRHDVARAGEEGFEAALRLLSRSADPGTALTGLDTEHQRRVANLAPALEQYAALTQNLLAGLDISGLRTILEGVQRQIGQPALLKMRHDLEEAIRPGAALAAEFREAQARLTRPDPALVAALQNLAALSAAARPSRRSPFESVSSPGQPALPPASGSGQDNDPADRAKTEGDG
jgi:predicted transcriptional regulator of viral defense system